eukprot:CAMPEP_0197240022 /NCGR_PEP_ID=MMETSP1429-20130617/6386_1 /TAXON_ID=49237 /ORGANISM="Chaetoceros  sp., Strain UNC1202" /LENGTH=727 /DNA_ID=CAMNT_0042699585 /DNA_START=201 /DNA_END=2384 /DNA_ORIENTATION=-
MAMAVSTMLPAVAAENPRKANKRMASAELREARKNGASPADIRKLKKKLADQLRVARAGNLKMATIKNIEASGHSIDDVKIQINKHNLAKKKVRGVFKKKEATLASVLFPGASPEEYRSGQSIDTIVDTVSSRRTELPFDYYKMPVCKPVSIVNKNRKRKNLGERLMGKTTNHLSPFNIKVLEDQSCTTICTVDLDFKMKRRMAKLVERAYTANLSIDGLPVNVPRPNGVVLRGYPLGSKLINEATGITQYVYHNHLRFIIEYNKLEANPGFIRIVGATVEPVSIDHDAKDTKKTCNSNRVQNKENTLLHLDTDRGNKSKSLPVTYSYEVEWIASEQPWTDRWDVFLMGSPDDEKVHHLSLVNSIMLVLFLMSCASWILIKTLRKDLMAYNAIDIDLGDDEEDALEERGWKMVHGDVFRPPSFSPMALSVLVGSGVQIALSLLGSLLMSQTNLVNPVMKGQALSNIVLLYVFSGTASGYVASRIFKFCGGKNWKWNTLLTAAFFPGSVMAMFLSLNMFLTFYGSATTVSLFTIICAFFLWVCIASPLVFIGSYLGFRRDAIEVPTRTNQIARVVPPQTGGPFVGILYHILLGVVPYFCAYLEINYVFGAIWMNQYYYLMGYLLAIIVLVGLVCALIAIISCYIRLNMEDHRWWWKSFNDSATFAIWLFIHSLWYLTFQMKLVGLMSVIVYVTYMAMISLAMGLFCGSISFLSTFWFTKKIYGTVKLD